MDLNIIRGRGDDEISDYVSGCPNSLVYSCPSFIDLVSNHLGGSPGWIFAKNEKGISGALPFVQSKEGGLGTVFNSLPYYGSNGGVLQHVRDDQVKGLLIEAFYDYAQSQDACSATIITNPLMMDHEIYENSIEGFIRDERIGQITHLPNDLDDELIKIFDDPRPRNIRRALKEGIQVSSGNERSSVEFLYEIHMENMKTIGGLSKSWDFFEKLLSDMPRDLWSVYVGVKDDMPIAALLVFYFNGTAEYFTPVIISEHRNTQALALVIYVAMKDAVSSKGCKNWNWGGTWLSQEGVYRFKKKWGAQEHRYKYFIQLNDLSLLNCTPKELVSEYPFFYTVPYSHLKQNSSL